MKQNRRIFFTDFQLFIVFDHPYVVAGIGRNADHFVVFFISDNYDIVPCKPSFFGNFLVALDNGTSCVKQLDAPISEPLFQLFCDAVRPYKHHVPFFEFALVLHVKAYRALLLKILGDKLVVNKLAERIDLAILFHKLDRHIERASHTLAKSCVFCHHDFHYHLPFRTCAA